MNREKTMSGLPSRHSEDDYKEIIQRQSRIISSQKDTIFSLYKYLLMHSIVFKKVKNVMGQQNVPIGQRRVLNRNDQEELHKVVLQIYAPYVKDLKKTYVNLSDEDAVLLCLQKFGMDSVSIASCFGYTDTRTINQRIYRIRRKRK